MSDLEERLRAHLAEYGFVLDERDYVIAREAASIGAEARDEQMAAVIRARYEDSGSVELGELLESVEGIIRARGTR